MGLNYSNKGDMGAHELMIYCIVRGIRPKTILEIGIRAGVSTLAMCKAIEDGEMKVDYHCCDIEETSRRVQNGTKVPLTFHIMSSDILAKDWDKEIDILFIDGCHEYSQVKRDYFNFGPFIKSNGFIFFHDTNPPSEKYKTKSYCGDAYKILGDLEKDNSIEFITIPYSFGLTVCRKF